LETDPSSSSLGSDSSLKGITFLHQQNSHVFHE
jgi:hypothetical protein